MRGRCRSWNFGAGDNRFLKTKIMCRTEERGCEEQARPERLIRSVGEGMRRVAE